MVQKLIVGLTGGFGTGKSTVSKMLRDRGANVIDADKIAHKTLRKSSPVFKKIATLFPKAISRCGEYFHRNKIAEKVFLDSKKRERLEALIHPYVLQEMRVKVRAAKQKIVVVEVPLLFESGFDVFCDCVVAVTCSSEAKKARLRAKGFSPKQIKAREKAQMSESLKIKKSDFIIKNSNSISKTREDVERLWKRLNRIVSPR